MLAEISDENMGAARGAYLLPADVDDAQFPCPFTGHAYKHTMRRFDCYRRSTRVGYCTAPRAAVQLVYTEAVINEALRIYPPAPSTTRDVSQDSYQLGPYAIPKGAHGGAVLLWVADRTCDQLAKRV